MGIIGRFRLFDGVAETATMYVALHLTIVVGLEDMVQNCEWTSLFRSSGSIKLQFAQHEHYSCPVLPRLWRYVQSPPFA
jgi:hypothetical protein